MADKYEFKIDFDQLKNWKTDDENAFPVLSFIHVYIACGIVEKMTPIMKELDKQLCPLQHFFCNFNTMSKIHDLIRDNWSRYNIEITGDNAIQWIPKQPHTPRKRGKKVKAVVRDSILLDQNNFCPNLDNTVADDLIVCQLDD